MKPRKNYQIFFYFICLKFRSHFTRSLVQLDLSYPFDFQLISPNLLHPSIYWILEFENSLKQKLPEIEHVEPCFDQNPLKMVKIEKSLSELPLVVLDVIASLLSDTDLIRRLL